MRRLDYRRRRAVRRARKEAALRAKVRESEERLRTLVESIEEYASFMLDPVGRVSSWNRGAERLLGYTEEEVLGKPVSIFFGPEDRAAGHPAEVIWQTVTEGRCRVEGWRVRRDGTRFWADVTTRALYDDRGDLRGFVKVTHDLTERRRVEESLRVLATVGTTLAATLDHREALAGLARLMVPMLADCSILDVMNDGSIERIEVAVADPTKEDLAQMYRRFPPELDAPRSPAARVLRTGRPELVEEMTREFLESVARNSAQVRLAQELEMRSLIVVPLVARGQILGVLSLIMAESGRRFCKEDLAFASDIASRAALAVDNVRLLEEARIARGEAEQRARDEAALRKATASVAAAFTIEEIVYQIAQSALTATGSDGALVERVDAGLGEVEVVAVAGDGVLPLGARMEYDGSLAQAVIEAGEAELVPRLSEANGRVSPELLQAYTDCSGLAVPLVVDGTAIGALILLREPDKASFSPEEAARTRIFADLAALAFRKARLLEDSERRRVEMVQVMESRSRLMRGFSHDLKNPLGAADGYLQLLEEGIMGELASKQSEGLARARNAIGDAIGMIDDLLAFARAEEGNISVERQPVDLRETVLELTEEHRASASAKGLSMAVRIPDELPSLRSDRARICQVLGNLLSNAVKYVPTGGIEVAVELWHSGSDAGPAGSAVPTGAGGPPRQAGGEWARISVRDTGPGIPNEEQQFLFKEFVRLESASGVKGAGIGLAIGHQIALALGGDITVESEVGHGATFTLWLPVESGR